MIIEPQKIGKEFNKYFTDIRRPSLDNKPDLQFQGDSTFETHEQLERILPP